MSFTAEESEKRKKKDQFENEQMRRFHESEEKAELMRNDI